MKLYEKFADKGFHTTIITTFSIDFDAYETIVLPRLRGAGSYNNVLLIDQGMLMDALSGASTLPKFAGSQYSVIEASAKGVFHPKIVFQVGRTRGRIIIGSANTTVSGLAGNLEVVGCVECTADVSSEQSIISDCWQYLSRILKNRAHSCERQIDWMLARTPWIRSDAPSSGLVSLGDGTSAAMLGAGGAQSIMGRYTELIGEGPIESLTVVSPYWDSDLGAAQALAERLSPKRVNLLLDPTRELFPVSAVDKVKNLHLYDIRELSKDRFSHAKLIVASVDGTDHILFGSANCTVAALGSLTFAGTNEEACLYKSLPSGEILQELDIEKIIADSEKLKSIDIRPLKIEENDGEEAKINPGAFAFQFGTFLWIPSDAALKREGIIELLDVSKNLIEAELESKVSPVEGEKRFSVKTAGERPAFARLKFVDGIYSSISVINVTDALLAECRESRGKNSERALARLSFEEDEGLWLLEIIDGMEAVQKNDLAVIQKSRVAKEKDTVVSNHEVLGYGEFVKGTRLRVESGGIGRNSLAGTEFSYVRAFLNRVLDWANEPENIEDDEAARSFVSAGTEANSMDDVEESETGKDKPISTTDEVAEAELLRQTAVRKKQTQDQIVKSIKAFIARIREKAKDESISSVDVLRIRAMLTIVSAAGWGEDSGPNKTSIQVLPPLQGETGWPRLMGQVLFAVFGGSKPAIRTLKVEQIFDQIPDDLFECWACCYWAIQACIEASDEKMAPRLSKLAGHIYTETRLSTEQMLDDSVVKVLELMNKRFSNRLGLDSERLLSEHARYAALSPESTAG